MVMIQNGTISFSFPDKNSHLLLRDQTPKLLIHSNTTDGSTTFTDSAGTHTPAIEAADVEHDTEFKKFGTSSILFDGDSGWLSIPDHADWEMTSQTNFVVDFWVRHTDHVGTETYIGQYEDANNYWFVTHIHGSGLSMNVYKDAGAIITTPFGGEITDTSWHHIALCKAGNYYGIYKDGVQICYALDSDTDTLAGELQIGAFEGANFYQGSMDEIHLAHTNQLGANPALWLTDTGATGHSPTVAAVDVDISTTSKWGNASVLFDGDSGYVSIPDHANWEISSQTDMTIDMWVKHVDHVGNECYIAQVEDGTNYWRFRHVHGTGLHFTQIKDGGAIVALAGGEITDTDWHHVAFCKVGDDYAAFLDGTETATVNDNSTDTLAGALSIGSQAAGDYFQGNIDCVRLTHDNAFNVVMGAAGLTDKGGSSHGACTEVGGGGLTTDQAKWGRQSYYMDGTNDYLTLADHADWDLSSTDGWCIDGWVRLSDPDTGSYIISQYEDGTNFWYIWQSTYTWGFQQTKDASTLIVCSGNTTEIVAADTWHHFAIGQVGNEHGVYVNGTQIAYFEDADTDTLAGPLYIGSKGTESVLRFEGYMNDLRVSVGDPFSMAPDAGKTDTITVPTSPHVSAGANTQLLLDLNVGGLVVPTGQHTSDSDTKLLLPFNADEIVVPKGRYTR